MGQERLTLAMVDRDIGHWLANLRTERGYTQEKLAELSGSRQCSISRIENGHGSPTLTTLIKLFGAMDMNLYIGASDV